jgi:hypothetical protein
MRLKCETEEAEYVIMKISNEWANNTVAYSIRRNHFKPEDINTTYDRIQIIVRNIE